MSDASSSGVKSAAASPGGLAANTTIGLALASTLLPGYGIYKALEGLWDNPRPVDVYRGTMGNIGPNQLIRPDGNGNWLHYGYSRLGHHDAGRTWQDMQGRALDDYNYAHGPMDNGMTRAGEQFFKPGFITHMPGQGPSPSPLGPASGISAALAPYFAGQPYAPPVGIGTTPGGR